MFGDILANETNLVNLTAEARCLVIYVGKQDCLVNLKPEVQCAVKLVMVNSRMIHRGRPVVGNPTFDLLIMKCFNQWKLTTSHRRPLVFETPPPPSEIHVYSIAYNWWDYWKMSGVRAELENYMASVNLWGGDKNVLVARVDSRATNLMGKTYCMEGNL